MTLTQISVAFLALMAVIVGAMLAHSFIDKRRIRKAFRALALSVPGEVVQKNPFVYPYFSTLLDGKKIAIFFQVVKAGRRHLLYLIYSVEAKIGTSLLLIKDAFFRPGADEAALSAASGPLLPRIDGRYLARSKDEAAATELFIRADLTDRLTPLEEFTSFLLGPDSIVAGKPYEGLAEVQPEALEKNLSSLNEMASSLERASISIGSAGGAPPGDHGSAA
jgi:hypothetical protein